MFSSSNENKIGFSAIGQKELEVVNGGTVKGGEILWQIIKHIFSPPRPRPKR